ncbi:Fur family transcriptional regulator [Saxibacter everestensis]|uniref:Fur family transcriptional regulator n=1 Tax=Saxibacter everestensis TaxID=2909229 RepID=A0ABY8QW10_9MICO|nr:Fur family transcriptional regulator [Brevibacteriaceae bacterium ZFBP1038]
MPAKDFDSVTALRDAGLRVTAPRLAVLDVLRSSSHVDAETITRDVRAKLGSVSTQAIYDVLHALNSAEIVRRIDPSGAAAARYELHRHDNHHHLVCRGCEAIVDVACDEGHAPCLSPQETSGFAIDEAEIIFWGLCPSCFDVRNGEHIGDIRGTQVSTRRKYE